MGSCFVVISYGYGEFLNIFFLLYFNVCYVNVICVL